MSQEIQKKPNNSTALQLTPSPREFLDKIRIHSNFLEPNGDHGYEISDRFAPRPDEVIEYQRRASQIQDGMRSELDMVKKRLARLFLLFPIAGQTAGSSEVVDAYASVMSGFPLWAIDSACKKVIASGATFRPSAPELRKLAAEACKPLFEEAETLHKLISAKPYHQNAENERARVIAGFRQLRSGYDAINGPHRKTVAECERDIATGFSHLQGPLTVSNALRASLGSESDAPR